LVLVLSVVSCGLLTPASIPTSQPVPITQAVPQLTVGQIKNAQYQLGARDDHPTVQLQNGKFGTGTDATTVDFADVTLSDFIALGDINGDGLNEAAVVVFENYGGSGVFGFLALYVNQDGQPVFLDSVMIDDRPRINGLGFDGNEIHLDATIHGFQDPGCCPALPTVQQYRFVGSNLRLSKFITNTPTGEKRELLIQSPVEGTAISGQVQVQGNVSISPFENTLGYSVYDESFNKLASGAISVTATELGMPGTFDSRIDLSMILPDTEFFLQIEDVSAADGSILAMDSVQLTVK
jgi:hypothetical protein